MYRATFSKSVANHVLTFLDDSYEARKIKFEVGRNITTGEKSNTGIYGILDSRKGRVLRISVNKNMAEYLSNDNSRYLAEISITNIGERINGN